MSLLPNESPFLKNHEVNNKNALGKATPLASNFLACEVDMPEGENYTIGKFYSELTNETYWWTYNSNQVHYVSRISEDGICEIVYQGDCLELSAEPRHSIEEGRAYMRYERICSNRSGKYIVWVYGEGSIGYIDTEASINTNFFTTPFFDLCRDDCAYIQLCVPEPKGCLLGEYVPYAGTDTWLANKILDKGLKFMYRHVYYDGRASEWSGRSTLYFQDSKGCFDNTDGFARCIKFRVPVGNPMVDIIEFAFSEDNGANWYISERIEKYKKYNNSQQFWYERELSEDVANTFSANDCSFDYIFCNDKDRIAVDPLAVSREYNPYPLNVQWLLPLKDMLGFVNYDSGFCPIDKIQTEKFKISLDCGNAANCKTEFSKVTVRAIIHNDSPLQRNQFVYRLGAGSVDDVTDTAQFGGLMQSLGGGLENAVPYNQYFNGKVRNFIVYIEGTGYYAEMKQWHASQNWNDREFHGIVDDMGDTATRNQWRKDVRSDNFFYQEAIITVPRGTQGFLRITSNLSEYNNDDTSASLVGIYNDLRNYRGNHSLSSNVDTNKREIYFNTCAGDQDISTAFVVEDSTTQEPGNQSSSYSGYLKDANGKQVEGAIIVPYMALSASPTYTVTPSYTGPGNYELTAFQVVTDHNGYFHTRIYPGNDGDVVLRIKVELDCSAFSLVKSVTVLSSSAADTNVGVIRITNDDNSTYASTSLAKIKVQVLDCDDVGVAGVRVALSGSKYVTTLADGFATFSIRNYYTRNRTVTALTADNNGCFTLDCLGNCNPCYGSPNVLTPACYATSVQTIMLYHIRINKESALQNRKGLKNGGRYSFAVGFRGDCGIQSAAYETQYIDIPKSQETGMVEYCNFSFDGTGMTLPDGLTELTILRSANINPFELQWIVDSFEKTDDGKIKITIQSLNDYNASYFFKTNTVYQYLAGDRVEFIKNGDGLIFDTTTYGVLNYLALSPFNDQSISGVKTVDDANYFNQILIEDDGKLDGLKNGAVIELQRPLNVAVDSASDSTTAKQFFEICASIPLKRVENTDGTYHTELIDTTGEFSTFDTYLVNRTIGKFPSQSFEHHSPSDFWGTRFTDIGKTHFTNVYENQKRIGRGFTFNSPTQFNYFGDIVGTFEDKQQGDVIAVTLNDDKIGLAICENDNFLFQASDELVRVGSDNVIRAAPANSVISNPQAKVRGKYGCIYDDIGSIFFGDGFVKYIDAKNKAEIIHNYSYAREAGTSQNEIGETETSCSSYFRRRITEKEFYNKSIIDPLDKIRYSTGRNKDNGVIYQTRKTLRDFGTNNASSVYELRNETIMYSPENDNYLGFASFTQEGYSTLNLRSEYGCALISFQNAKPYIHPIIPETYNTFNGNFCDWYIEIVVNAKNKIIIPLAVEQQSSAMFFAKKVTTDNANFLSEVPPIKPNQTQQNKWNFSLLANKNSRSGLFGSELPRGYYISILLQRDNSINLAYQTVDNNKLSLYSEISAILVKFLLSAQNGFDENL